MSWARVSILLCLGSLAASCASQPITREAKPSTAATSPSPSLTPFASPTPRSLSGDLPRSGFAVGHGKAVTFVALDREVLERLPGFELAGSSENKGVWLQRGRDYFRLHPADSSLRPVAPASARDRIYDGGPEPGLPVPVGGRYRGMTIGRWSYVVPGPGAVSLAQWSGECEVPTAFWTEGSEVLVLATGERKLGGPESIALGWGSDGTAFAHLREGYCGGAADPPGIYAFSAPGEGRLVYRTPPGARVDMWWP